MEGKANEENKRDAITEVGAGSRRDSKTGVSMEQYFDVLYCKPRPTLCGVNRFVIFVIFMAASSSLLLGYDIGVWAIAKIRVQERFSLSDEKIEVLVGILNLVSAFGGLASGRLSDQYGRRGAIAMACALFLFGSAFKVSATGTDSQGYAMLMVGRVATGLGVGAGLSIAPLYSAELAPKRIRGAVVSFAEVAINIGILLGYAAGWAYSALSLNLSWRLMLAMGAVPPLWILVSLWWLPESPRWLVQKGRERQAAAVLARACSREEATETLNSLREMRAIKQGSWRDFASCVLPERHRPKSWGKPSALLQSCLLAGLGTAFFQQSTGVEAQVYYTPEILESAGWESESKILLGQLVVGLVKVAFILVATFTLDRKGRLFGRKPLLIISALGMGLAQGLLAVNFLVGSTAGFALFAQSLFMASFSVGMGPVTWVLLAELFPLNVRGLGMGIATFVNRITSGIIAMSFLSLTKGVTIAGAFMIFAFASLVAAVFTHYYVVETKGRSLEEIERETQNRDGCLYWCCCTAPDSEDAPQFDNQLYNADPVEPIDMQPGLEMAPAATAPSPSFGEEPAALS